MGITILKSYVDNNKIMNMVKILSETIFRDVWMDSSDNEVASCSDPNLVSDMAGKDELAIIPREFKLYS